MGMLNPVVTEAGALLLTGAAAGEAELIFTRAQLGAGRLTNAAEADLRARSALVSPACYVPLDAPTLADGIIRVPALFSNRLEGGGYMSAFTATEAGLWGRLGADGAETLLVYACADAGELGTEVPDDTLFEFTYLFKLSFAGAAQVTMSAESLTFVTREMLEAALRLKANAVITVAATALAGAWEGEAAPYAQVVSVGPMTATAGAVVGLSHTATAEQARECRRARLRATAQGAGTVTLAADGIRPTADMPLTVIIFS